MEFLLRSNAISFPNFPFIRSMTKGLIVRFIVLTCCVHIATMGKAQWKDPVEELLKKVVKEERVPADLLAKKSVLLFDPSIKGQHLDDIQQIFQKTGIDVVLHYPMDVPASNEDVNKVFVNYLNARDISFLIFLKQRASLFEFLFIPFNRKSNWADAGQSAWHVSGLDLNSTLESIYRVALSSQKKKNLLIIESPEKELNLDPVTGNRNEFFTLDLKVDKLAVIRTGVKEVDQQMEDYIKLKYPFSFTVFEAGSDEQQIRSKGFLYTLKAIRCRNIAAMDLLGYDLGNVGHRIKGVTFINGNLEETSLPADEIVYKFYFKHLTNGNIYLGTKWDAAVSWQQALDNQIQGVRATFGIR